MLESFRRLFADGRSSSGAAGASDFLVDHRPTVWSAEAESTREDGACTAKLSTEDRWPNISSVGTSEASPTSVSAYFHSRSVRSIPELAWDLRVSSHAHPCPLGIATYHLSRRNPLSSLDRRRMRRSRRNDFRRHIPHSQIPIVASRQNTSARACRPAVD